MTQQQFNTLHERYTKASHIKQELQTVTQEMLDINTIIQNLPPTFTAVFDSHQGQRISSLTDSLPSKYLQQALEERRDQLTSRHQQLITEFSAL